jgi:hypothetical protein
MGHVAALAIHLCSTGSAAATSGGTGSGGGGGFDTSGLAIVFGILTMIGLVAAGVTFIVARRLPPPTPAPIPVWINNLPRP